jgi:hypothetical protein
MDSLTAPQRATRSRRKGHGANDDSTRNLKRKASLRLQAPMAFHAEWPKAWNDNNKVNGDQNLVGNKSTLQPYSSLLLEPMNSLANGMTLMSVLNGLRMNTS